MALLRRRLASCALALVLCQIASVFAAPLSSCCPPRESGHGRVAEAEKDCCPAGAHAPGACPVHGRNKAPKAAECRMQCDAPHGVQFLIGVAALLPPPVAVPAAPVVFHAVVLSAVDPQTRPFVPDLPPPRV